MALANTNITSETSRLRGLFARSFSELSDRIRRRRVYASTKKELSMLSTRELNDIGLCRGDIEPVSRQAAELA